MAGVLRWKIINVSWIMCGGGREAEEDRGHPCGVVEFGGDGEAYIKIVCDLGI